MARKKPELKNIGDWIKAHERLNPGKITSVLTGSLPDDSNSYNEIRKKWDFTKAEKNWKFFPKERREEMIVIGTLLRLLDRLDFDVAKLLHLTDKAHDDARRLEVALMSSEDGREMMELLKQRHPGLLHNRVSALNEA